MNSRGYEIEKTDTFCPQEIKAGEHFSGLELCWSIMTKVKYFHTVKFQLPPILTTVSNIILYFETIYFIQMHIFNIFVCTNS